MRGAALLLRRGPQFTPQPKLSDGQALRSCLNCDDLPRREGHSRRATLHGASRARADPEHLEHPNIPNIPNIPNTPEHSRTFSNIPHTSHTHQTLSNIPNIPEHSRTIQNNPEHPDGRALKGYFPRLLASSLTSPKTPSSEEHLRHHLRRSSPPLLPTFLGTP